jgi:hypothetical protein
MTTENTDDRAATWVKWVVASAISLCGAGGGIVALVQYCNPPEPPSAAGPAGGSSSLIAPTVVEVPPTQTAMGSAGGSPPVIPSSDGCVSPWKWRDDLKKCTKEVTVASKRFDIPLERAVSKVEGRIDFYMNLERLADQDGQASYKSAPGRLQAVIPIMRGTQMVGSKREVIYSTTDGTICGVGSLAETTGHFKSMKVGYSVQLPADCPKDCRATLLSPKKAQVTTRELIVTVCNKKTSDGAGMEHRD